jgi:hypothetical protein
MLLSKFNNWNDSEKLQGEVEKVKENFHSIFIKLKVTGEGKIHIYWSDFKSKPLNEWEDFGDSWIFQSNDLSFKSLIKGKYFYIKFTDTDNLTALDVKTYFTTSDMIENKGTLTASSSVLCMAENPALKQVPLKVDNDGKLITTGSGGGGGGDASASNQLIEIGELQELNNKTHISNINLESIRENIATHLTNCDTDNVIINSTNPVNVLGLAKVENTLNNAFLTVDSAQNLKVTVANQNDLSTLAKEETLTQIKTELINNMPTKQNQVEIGETVQTIEDLMLNVDYTQGYADIYTDAVTLGADSNPAFTTHPTLDGWYYQNTALNGASNLYFYANSGGQQKQHKVSELYSSYVVCNILNASNSSNTPFLVVYSKPTGTNDYAPWYHSKWVYKIANSSIISPGQEFMMFQGQLPNQQIFPHVPRVEAVLIQTLGEGNKATEDLLYCTVNTDSGATQNTTKVVYTGVGYNLMGRNSIIELGVGKQQQTRDIKDKIDNLSSIVGAGVFVQLDSNINGLKLKSSLNDGSADVNVKNQIDVSTLATQETLNDLKTLVDNQSDFNRFQTEAVVTDGKLDTIMNNMSTLDFKVNNLTKCDTDNVIIQSGSVSVSNFPETQSVSGSVSVSNFPETQQVSGSVNSHIVDIANSPLTFTNVGLKNCGDVVINNNSLNVHCFGSSDGTTFHHLKTNTQGVLSTNAIIETDNGALTSTIDDDINALDVSVKNVVNTNLRTSVNGLLTSTNVGTTVNALDVSIKGTETTQLAVKAKKYGSWGNVYNNEISVLPSTASPSINVSDWAYVGGWYEDYTSTFGSGMIKIQFSFDNITFYDINNVSLYPNTGTGGKRTTSLYKIDLGGLNYIRMFNDTTTTLTGVTFTVWGASL